MIRPSFYDSQQVGQLYAPRMAAVAAAAFAAPLPPADEDRERVLLLLVDAQVDFVHEDGALSVPGAVADTRRTIEWIYSHLDQITTIAASLDSHLPLQIFFPTWWVDSDGRHPEPYTLITAESVAAGMWLPLYEAEWSRGYVERLEAHSKKQLMIWPFHTLIGTPGHSLTPALYEAIAYHAAVRRAQPLFINKGTIARTEYYSMLEPEVKIPGEAQGDLNRALLDRIASYDRVYIAGQAKSHCVLETVASLTRHLDGGEAALHRLHLLTDAMSSVAHPEIDFEALAQAAFADFERAGVRLTTTIEGV